MPREPEPLRGLTKAGSSIAGGIEAGVGDDAAGNPDMALTRLLQAPLVEAGLERRLAPASTSAMPAASNSSRRRAIGSSSLSTVGTSTVDRAVPAELQQPIA